MKYQYYLNASAKLVEQCNKEAAHGPQLVTVCNRLFVISPEVFSPKVFEDTEIFATNLPVKVGMSLLEIGCGSGAVSITAIFRGAKSAVCVDKFKAPYECCKLNVQLHKLTRQIEVRQGDVFSAIGSQEKFDCIFWNVPFGLVSKNRTLTPLQYAVFDPGYNSIRKYLEKGPAHLTANGRLLIGYSSTLGKPKLLQKLTESTGRKLKTVFAQTGAEIYPVQFEILESAGN